LTIFTGFFSVVVELGRSPPRSPKRERKEKERRGEKEKEEERRRGESWFEVDDILFSSKANHTSID